MDYTDIGKEIMDIVLYLTIDPIEETRWEYYEGKCLEGAERLEDILDKYRMRS